MTKDLTKTTLAARLARLDKKTNGDNDSPGYPRRAFMFVLDRLTPDQVSKVSRMSDHNICRWMLDEINATPSDRPADVQIICDEITDQLSAWAQKTGW